MALSVVKDLKNLNEQLQKMSAAELEKAREVSRDFVPDELRLAVAEAIKAGSAQFRHGARIGSKLIARSRDFRKDESNRKKLKAFTISPQSVAGPAGIVNDFPAIGTQQMMVMDYFQPVTLSGTQLRVQSATHTTGSVADLSTEGANKPVRVQQLNSNSEIVSKVAAVTYYSYEAYTVFGDDLIDFLALQLTLDVLERVNFECYIRLLSGVPFVPPGAGTVPSPNFVDLFALMVQQERLEVLYSSPRRVENSFVVAIPQTYYDRLRFLKDAQGRQLYSSWEEALPEAEIVSLNLPFPTPPAIVFRPQHYFLGILDDVQVINLGPIVSHGDLDQIEFRNTYGIAVEMLVAPTFTIRHQPSTTAGYSRVVSNIPTALANI